MRVITGDARQPVKSPIIVLRGGVAVISFHQADEICVEVCHSPVRALCFLK